MDYLAIAHFESEVEFGKAMELIHKYCKIQIKDDNWFNIEEGFLAELDDYDSKLLEKAIKYHRSLGNSINPSLGSNSTNPTSEDLPTRTKSYYISDLIGKFLSEKAASAAPSTVKSYDEKCRRFEFIMKTINDGADPTLEILTAENLRKYKEIISSMPKSLIKGMQFETYIKQKETVKSPNALSPKTVENTFILVSNFLKWLEDQKYPVTQGLRSIISQKFSQKEKDRVTRGPFNQNELDKIFNCDIYTSDKRPRDSDYWAPIIALYTGATQAEILQLHVSDIREEGKLWIITFNDEGEKQLKNDKARVRELPIHPHLLEVGFRSFVDHQRSKGNVRLFSDEKRNKTGEYSAFSKRFNRYKEKAGVKGSTKSKKDFHSFRHLVSSTLIGKGVDEGIVSDILGHSYQQRSESRRTYAKAGASNQTKLKKLQILDFRHAINNIKAWAPKNMS